MFLGGCYLLQPPDFAAGVSGLLIQTCLYNDISDRERQFDRRLRDLVSITSRLLPL